MTALDPQPIVVSRQQAVATIRFNRPAVLNAIDLDTARAFPVAADDVRFNLADVAVAASPDCGSTWHLVHLVGLRKAMELALLGDKVEAAEALRLGLVNRVVPLAELESATESVARRLAAQSPLAIARTKTPLRAAVGAPFATRLDAERVFAGR